MDFRSVFGVDPVHVLVTALAMGAFGYFYNVVVDDLHEKGHDEGYTWALVVVGVAAVVFAAAFTIGWEDAVLLLVYFAASGAFMAWGDWRRHVEARKAESIEALEDDVTRFLNGGNDHE